MTPRGNRLCGVIEGFYGRSWSFDTRLAYAGYLVRLGLNTCLYCPKSDPFLRKRWREHWPRQQWQQLLDLAAAYRHAQVNWGVGLSPYALYRDYGPVQRQQLRDKVHRLAELEAPLLAILFDDMPGDVADLAQRQAEIVADVTHWLPAVHLLVCPTYYSFDPVLARHFGAMPDGYWQQLGALLPAGAEVFWTGNRVCSETIRAGDIRDIVALLGRPVLLWDNYPVNDGAVRSNFLYCHALTGRDCLPDNLVSGHLCNPMNQALLSLPALVGLATLYGNRCDSTLLEEVLGESTWRRLRRDRELFEREGLSGLGPQRCRQLAAHYRALPGEAAAEVAGWLGGEYAFDPACLTD